MICLIDNQGRLIRTFGTEGQTLRPLVIGFHRRFGAVSEEVAESRLQQRKQAGLSTENCVWDFKLEVSSDERGHLTVREMDRCSTRLLTVNRAQVISAGRKWEITSRPHDALFAAEPIAPAMDCSEADVKLGLSLLGGICFATLLIALLVFPAAEKFSALQAKPMETVFVSEEVSTDQPRASFSGGLAFLQSSTSRFAGGPSRTAQLSISNTGSSSASGARLAARLAGGSVQGSIGKVSGLKQIHVAGVGSSRSSAGLTSGEARGVAESVSLQEISSEEGLDPNVVFATVNQYLHEVRGCYESLGLSGNARLQGRVAIHFEVAPSGNLNFAEVSQTTLNLSSVENCIRERMMGWRFPKPLGGKSVKVTYPFLFRPVSL